MRIAILFFSFLGALILLAVKQSFLKISLPRFENGIEIPSIELFLGRIDVGIYGLTLKGNRLKAEVVSVSLPPPPQPYVLSVENPDYLKWRDFLNRFLAVLGKLPIEVGIKDLYIREGDISVNLYWVEVLKNLSSIGYGEVFLPNGKVFNFSTLSLQRGGSYATLGGNFAFNSFKGDFVISYDPLKGNILFNTSVRKGDRRISLLGNAKLLRTPKGFVKLSTNFGGLWGNFTLKGYRLIITAEGRVKGLNFSAKGNSTPFPTLKGVFEGELTSFCGRRFFFSLHLWDKALSGAVIDISDSLYLSAFVPFGEEWRILGALSNGTILFKGNPAAFRLRAEKISLKNFCRLSLKGVNGSLEKWKGRLKGYLKFNEISLPPLSVADERISILQRENNLLVSLEGNIRGLLSKYGDNLWGYLYGSIFLNRKPLKFNIPHFEVLSEGRKRFISVGVENLSWDSLKVEGLGLNSLYGKDFFKLTLEGNGTGYLEYSRGIYKAYLSLWVFGRKTPFRVEVSGIGSPRKGRGEVHIDNIGVSLSYRKRKKVWYISHKGFWKFVSFGGNWKISKSFANFEENIEINNNPWGIVGVFTLLGKSDTDLNSVDIRLLPSCVAFLGEKVICFKNGLFSKRGNNLFLSLESFKNLPLYAVLQSKLTDFKFLDLKLLLEVKKSLLNHFLVRYGSYIVSPSKFSIPFSYSGEISSFLQRLNWYYTTRAKVLSLYAYKPLEVYLTFSSYGGSISALIGFADALSKETYGSLSATFNGRTPEIGIELSNFPFRVSFRDNLRGYINLGIHGEIKRKNGKFSVNGKLLSGGFVKVLSYKFPTEKGKGQKKLPLSGIISFLSSEPLYVETPNGKFTLTYSGYFKNSTLHAKVFINYGNLHLLGKQFYIQSGEIDINGQKVEVDIPIVYYAPDRTVYLHVYGSLPWENLKFDIYSIPPAPREELLASLFSGGGELLTSNLPLVKVLLQNTFSGIANAFSSTLLKGIAINFEPTFDPLVGFTVGIDIEKYFDDFAAIGYHWLPSVNPKATYIWGSVRFFGNTFLRGVRYSNGATSLLIRFTKEFGLPF